MFKYPETERICQLLARKYQVSNPGCEYEDLTQEAYIKALQLQDTFVDAHGAWTGYLYNRLSFHLIDFLRVHGPVKRRAPDIRVYSLDEMLADPTDVTQPNRGEEQIEAEDFARWAFSVHDGPDREKDVAYLYINGYAHKQIGDHFGFSESRSCQLWVSFVDRVQRCLDQAA